MYMFFNIYFKSLLFFNNQCKFCRAFNATKNIPVPLIHVELWKCDLLKTTTNGDPDRILNRDTLALKRYK